MTIIESFLRKFSTLAHARGGGKDRERVCVGAMVMSIPCRGSGRFGGFYTRQSTANCLISMEYFRRWLEGHCTRAADKILYGVADVYFFFLFFFIVFLFSLWLLPS